METVKQLIKDAKQLIKYAFSKVKSLYEREPARFITWTVSAVIAVAAYFDVALDAANVNSVVQVILPILLGGEFIRQKVTPEKKVQAKAAAAKRGVNGAKRKR